MTGDKFLYRVAGDLLKRFGDDLQNVAIVFNNKRPQLFLKKYLSEISGKPIWSPDFYTIQQFFSVSTTQVCASQLKQFLVLFTVYYSLLRSEGNEPVSADVFIAKCLVVMRVHIAEKVPAATGVTGHGIGFAAQPHPRPLSPGGEGSR